MRPHVWAAVIGIVILVSVLVGATPAQAATQGTTTGVTRSYEVIPHGVAPVTVKPLLGSGCDGQLKVYQNSTYGGAVACFDKVGEYNFASFQMCGVLPINCPSWSKQISSFSAGATEGEFASGANYTGTYVAWYAGENVSYVGNALNDTWQSMYIGSV